MTDPAPDRIALDQRAILQISYRNVPRPLLWLKVARDGSVYLGTWLGKFRWFGRVSRARSPLIRMERPTKGGRVTFHPSGAIHMGHDKFRGDPFREIKETRKLAQFRFAHPGTYPPAKPDPRDHVIPGLSYPVDDARPISGSLFMAGWTPGERYDIPPRPPSIDFGMYWIFYWCGMTAADDFALLLTVGHGPVGRWPVGPISEIRPR